MKFLNILKRPIVFLSLLMLMAFAGCSSRPESGNRLQGNSPSIHENGTVLSGTVVPNQVSLFFTDPVKEGGEAGDVGCGDTLVEVPLQEKVLSLPGDTLTVIEKTLKKLFALEGTEYGVQQYYNALGNSSLEVEDVALQGSQIVVRITGKLSLGGVCDNPRAEAQLTHTVQQFHGAENALIYLNGKPLNEALSLKGEQG